LLLSSRFPRRRPGRGPLERSVQQPPVCRTGAPVLTLRPHGRRCQRFRPRPSALARCIIRVPAAAAVPTIAQAPPDAPAAEDGAAAPARVFLRELAAVAASH